MNNKAEVCEALTVWLSANNQKVSASEITSQTKIIEDRLLTSLKITDLILYIEELRQSPVSASELTPFAFCNIESIYSNFFASNHHDPNTQH